jgi:Fe2+ or Zn2+ uptake regulation protein
MKNDIKSQFKRLGLKLTAQRKAILEAFASINHPVSIDELKKISSSKKIDKVTFYRNIETLKKAGLVKRVDFMRGHALWERADLGDHHHLICTGCKRVEDIHNCNVDSLARRAIRKSKNFKLVTGHSLELFGRCRQCSKI